MTDAQNTFRLYSDLAWLWPLWGDATGEYAQYCDHVVTRIGQYARRPVTSLLNIGCGGGKNVFNLKKHYRVTGVDLSPAMLRLANDLNPECEFTVGDMRSFALGRTFDAVLMDDAISYMASKPDLEAAFRVAFLHLNPGGVMVTGPDDTKETFAQNRTRVSHADPHSKPDDLDVVFIENDYDPDPSDDHYEATMVYLIRDRGKLRVETDHHRLGLFSTDVWRETLVQTGFEVHAGTYAEDGREYLSFACVKPE